MMRIEEVIMNSLTIRLGSVLVRALVLVGAIAIAPLASADDFRIESREGVIDTADFQANEIVISGVRYVVAVDANVEVGGSYGAYTLLTPGMNVRFLLRRYIESGEREIIDLEELPAGVMPEEY
jgi:hypothetical protein